jgi:hypothetical protein
VTRVDVARSAVVRAGGGRAGAVRTAGAWAAAATLSALVWWTVHPGGGATPAERTLVHAAAWVVFAAGVWLVRRLPSRRAAALIVIGGIGLQVAALSAPPRTSTDAYRYVWDGRVQAAGIDPYRYVPAAPELAHLRDPEFLWARTARSWCVGPRTPDPDRAGPDAFLAPGCTLINRPAVHTIYPPVAEGYFTAVHALSPPGARIKPIQVAAALAAGATTLLLLYGLRRLGRHPGLAAYWAFCPLVALEAGNNAHVDVVAAGLTVLALVTLAGPRPGPRPGGRTGWSRAGALLGGGVLGLAIATKLFPALILPAAARRRPVAIGGAAAGAVAAGYLPHVLAVGGAGVLGYLPGYLKEEGYDSGSRFALLTLVVPAAWAGLAAVTVLAGTGLLVWRTADPGRPWRGALVMAGVFLLVTSPALPWYGLLVIALVALDGRAEWLAVGAAGYVMWAMIALGLPGLAATRAGYGAAAVTVAGAPLWRAARTRAARRDPANARPLPVAAGGRTKTAAERDAERHRSLVP